MLSKQSLSTVGLGNPSKVVLPWGQVAEVPLLTGGPTMEEHDPQTAFL